MRLDLNIYILYVYVYTYVQIYLYKVDIVLCKFINKFQIYQISIRKMLIM